MTEERPRGRRKDDDHMSARLERALEGLTDEVKSMSKSLTKLQTRFEQLPEVKERVSLLEKDMQEHKTLDIGTHSELKATTKRLTWAVGVLFAGGAGGAGINSLFGS